MERRTRWRGKKEKRERDLRKNEEVEVEERQSACCAGSLCSPSLSPFFPFLKTTPRDRSHVAPLQRPLQGGRPLRPLPRPGQLGLLQVSVVASCAPAFLLESSRCFFLLLLLRRRRASIRGSGESLAAAILACSFCPLSLLLCPYEPLLRRSLRLFEPSDELEAKKARTEAEAGHVVESKNGEHVFFASLFRFRPRERTNASISSFSRHRARRRRGGCQARSNPLRSQMRCMSWLSVEKAER